MADTVKRAQFTAVAPRFQRSINLHNDWYKDDVSSGYIVTPNVAQSLERLFRGVLSPKGQRSFALTGPYGSGKSAFAVFASQLLGRDQVTPKKAESLLPPKLKSTLKKVRGSNKNEKGFLVIPITARRRPIAQLILEGISTVLGKLPQGKSIKSLQAQVSAALIDDAWHDTSIVVKSLTALLVEAKKQGFGGALLIIDEAGKTLEYALQDRGGGDVYIFQELAEFAGRQEELPLLFLILLHQMFDDYVELSDRTLKNEWNKIQERFQSIQFAESAAATIRMVASAFQPQSELPDYVCEEIDTALRLIQQGAMTLPVGIEFT
ncbi:MAG TPA: hypothetical protein ENG14_00075, partial [Thermodesulforhabdus norvegica]|nr:hypothetical protein [Thermodesulforhabdus norvegica]